MIASAVNDGRLRHVSLNYLVLIEIHEILPALFDRVLIPETVRRELQSASAPERIHTWMASAPTWLEVRAVAHPSADLPHLDPGERDAIALSESVGATLVLLDEKRGRHVARERGLVVSGTLGVIDLAGHRGLVNVADALDRLQQTTFRASPELLRYFLQRSRS